MISKGILAFAQGQSFLKLALYQLVQLRKISDIDVDYIVDENAEACSEYQQLVDLGATLIVANSPTQSRNYDLSAEWKNLGRDKALKLSPWDKTLLVDVDYIIQSTASLDLLEADLPLVCAAWHHCFDQEFILDHATIGRHAIKMLWATLVWFDKGPDSQQMFDRWSEVLKHLKWRKEYYGFHSSLVRNDYALSIAVHELGQESSKHIAVAPYSQMAIPPWCTYTVDDDGLTVLSTTADKPLQILNLSGLDFHALNKNNLLEVL